LIAGVLGSLSCFFLAIQASKGEYKLVQALKYVGIYSMGIYLFHTPFMGPIRIFLLQVIKLSDYWFFPTALIVVNIGLIIPIFLEKYVIRRQPILARSLLGIKA
jgi:hypothetical protein